MLRESTAHQTSSRGDGRPSPGGELQAGGPVDGAVAVTERGVELPGRGSTGSWLCPSTRAAPTLLLGHGSR